MHHILNIYIIHLSNDVIDPEIKMKDCSRSSAIKGIQPSTNFTAVNQLKPTMDNFKNVVGYTGMKIRCYILCLFVKVTTQ